MKRFSVYLFLVLGFVMVSFVNSNGKILLKQTKDFLSGEVTKYFYTPDGKIDSVVTKKGTTSFVYPSTAMILRRFSEAGKKEVVTDTIILRANHAFLERGKEGRTAKLWNNKIGQLLFSREFAKEALKQTNRYTYDRSNQKSLIVLDAQGKTAFTVSYEYADTNSVNTIGYSNTGMSWSGFDSKNLLTKSITVNGKGDTVEIRNYHYKTDTLGRVKLRWAYDQTGGLKDSMAFGY